MLKTISIIVVTLGFQFAQADSSEVSYEGLTEQQIADIQFQLEEMQEEEAQAEDGVVLPGPFKRKWKCYAENRWGDRFSGKDKRRWRAMEKALISCERRSRGRRCFRSNCKKMGIDIDLPF